MYSNKYRKDEDPSRNLTLRSMDLNLRWNWSWLRPIRKKGTRVKGTESLIPQPDSLHIQKNVKINSESDDYYVASLQTYKPCF